MAELWGLTIREIGYVLEAHNKRREDDLTLAYYQAYFSGFFSQPWGKKFPRFNQYAPGNAGQTQRQTPEQMKAIAMNIVSALGGTIRKRGE